MKYVHRPEMVRIGYDGCQPLPDDQLKVPLEQLLLITGYERVGSPTLQRPFTQSQNDVTNISPSSKKHCREQLVQLWRKVAYVQAELGSWAADYLILSCAQRLQGLLNSDNNTYFGSADVEKAYMLEFLGRIKLRNVGVGTNIPANDQLSQKLQYLISFLVERHTEKFSGMVFVQQRATASIVCKILSLHEQTRHRFRCAPYVGQSDFSGRKQSLAELHDIREQQNTLADFRNGKLNLLVTTDVLEEGVDIPVCSLVVCFNKPPNLKSFIQKRGRARQIRSVFAILVSNEDKKFSIGKWQCLEDEMIRLYQDDSRLLHTLEEEESVEETVDDAISVESTGFVMIILSAKIC